MEWSGSNLMGVVYREGSLPIEDESQDSHGVGRKEGRKKWLSAG